MLGRMEIDQWRTEIRPCGWVRLTERTGAGPTVYAQFKVTEHGSQRRLDLNSLVMRAGVGEPLSPRIARRIPLLELEEKLTAFVFGPPTDTQLPEAFDVFENNAEAFDLARREFFPGYYKGDPEADCDANPVNSLEEMFEDTADLTAISLFDAVFPHLSALPAGDDTGQTPPPIPPAGGRLTVEFLTAVADAYRWFADRGQAPSPGIAEQTGAPVRTVHRWVLEARKRGILPPARTGRAG